MSRDLAPAAAHRFGLGARSDELSVLARDPATALMSQIANGDPRILDAALPDAAAAVATLRRAMARLRDLQRQARDDDDSDTARREIRRNGGLFDELPLNEAKARLTRAVTTEDAFLERLVWFWSNWFTVAAVNPPSAVLAGVFEREAVRPHVTGRFEDMLKATALHPGMLVYLNNAQSAGPNSLAGRRRDRGRNENLAREILELHTVGVDAPYDQDDVIGFADALTGWTIDRQNRHGGGAFFEPRMHEPGSKRVLGKRYAESGAEEAVAILDDLARRPETARRVAVRLAAHFTADKPPSSLVSRLEQVFKDTDGDLAALARTLVESTESWAEERRKLRSPIEFYVASLRAADVETLDAPFLIPSLIELGQPPFRAPSPEGWPDDVESWAGPDGLKRRIEWAHAFARQVVRGDPLARAQNVLGSWLSDHTATAIRRAADPVQGAVLFLMSPEMQWR